MSEREPWCDNSSYNSASDTREHCANCSKNHLAWVGVNCHLADQDVERENCSAGNNQISADDRSHAAEGENESQQHQGFYIILCLSPKAIRQPRCRDRMPKKSACGGRYSFLCASGVVPSAFILVWKMASH